MACSRAYSYELAVEHVVALARRFRLAPRDLINCTRTAPCASCKFRLTHGGRVVSDIVSLRICPYHLNWYQLSMLCHPGTDLDLWQEIHELYTGIYRALRLLAFQRTLPWEVVRACVWLRHLAPVSRENIRFLGHG
jgi:hypothetical protein